MKKLIIGLALLLLAGALSACNVGGAQNANAQPTPLPAAKANNKVVAEAVVVPARYAKLSLPLGGTIAEVNVKQGDRVEAGQTLAKLDTRDLEIAIKRAEATLATSQAQLAKIKAPARDLDIQAAETKVANAEAVLRSAQGRMNAIRSRSGDSQASVTAAQGQLAAAQAALEKVTSGPTDEERAIAERKIEQAKNNLWGAQSRRDALCGRAGDAGSQKAREALQPECDGAKAAVQVAEEGVRLAELDLERLLAGAREADVKAARAQIQQSQGALAGAQARASASGGDIAAAEGEIANAQATLNAAQVELERVKSGARAEDIAVAEAQVGEAQTALASAKNELEKATLKAPFAGTVAVMDLRVGERIQPNTVVAQVADLSSWQIETTDLTELNVVHLNLGDKVLVTFDAIPGLEMPGTITRIGQQGENRQGDIVYTVVVTPDQQDARLRWRMTASVTFEATK